jgi:predicted N-formylglutamate amidohydrolase
VSQAWTLLGTPRKGGVLIISDHASNRVPDGLDLGIDPACLTQHVAIDIGVAGVAAKMVEDGGADAAWLAHVSRLVCDVNREEDAPGAIPETSDGILIPGNALDAQGRDNRLALYHRPYHKALAETLAAHEPGLILSLHSFTPALSARPEEARPWHIGVLYNQDDRAPRLALPWLQAVEGLCVGDQQPYSGRQLNYTMNRHAEAHGRLYLGVEVRQDLIGDTAGQAVWAQRLSALCAHLLGAAD